MGLEKELYSKRLSDFSEIDATLREYTSIYEAGNIRYQESHCTDYDSYGENDPIQSFFGKHDSGWGVFRLNILWPFVPPQRVSVWHHYHWISNRCRAKHQA